MKVTIQKAPEVILGLIQSGIPVNLIGSPGLGKSDIVKQVAKELNLKLIDFRLSTADPTDLTGLPALQNGRSVYAPNEAFPLVTDEIPEGYEGWLLFLDEITNAPMAVQAASYKLILDREVGLHKLHDKVIIVSAGNKEDDGAAVASEMSTALKSRMAHIEIQHHLDAWLEWAIDNKVHHTITSFIQFKSDILYQFDPNIDAYTFACPRTWSMVNQIVSVHGINNPNLFEMVAATISEGVAIEYCNFVKHYAKLPKFSDIESNPEAVDVPRESSVLYALSGSIANRITLENAEPMMIYLERMQSEFQLLTVQEIVRRERKEPTGVRQHARVNKWIVKNSPKLAELARS